jgi:hypothetical protein
MARKKLDPQMGPPCPTSSCGKAQASSSRPAAFYRDGLSPGLISALSWLREIFPALGDGALPQSQNRQLASGASGNVTLFERQTA